MKALIAKEWRENLRLAVLGLVIFSLLLLEECREYALELKSLAHGSTNIWHWQPLIAGLSLIETAYFCGIFGAVLGWLQIYHEKSRDLWAFLVHRPMSRSQIFLAKALSGLAIYVVVTGVPLTGFVTWARFPGQVAAPFEGAMLLPFLTLFLLGIVYYFAGLLTGLRQARWYAGRALGVGTAILVTAGMLGAQHYWQALLLGLGGGALLAVAAWGGFLTNGFYLGQPRSGKLALTTSLMLGGVVVAVAASVLLGLFLPRFEGYSSSHYVMTKDGGAYRVTSSAGTPDQVFELNGAPVVDVKTGRPIEPGVFGRRVASGLWLGVRPDSRRHHQYIIGRLGMSACPLWQATPQTLWYYWDRYGRLVAYDVATRRLLGSLGPTGFASDLVGDGQRFSGMSESSHGPRTLQTASAIWRVDLENRTAAPIFTSTNAELILGSMDVSVNEPDWDYTMVVTKRSMHLVTPEGKPVWSAPYALADPDYDRLRLFCLEPAGQFALWLQPTADGNRKGGGKLPTRVVWLARDQGMVKTAELPGLPPAPDLFPPREKLQSLAVPPWLFVAAPFFQGTAWPNGIPWRMVRVSLLAAAVICLPVGWWLGRRYHLSLPAQMGWAVFHLVCGVPGLLAFLTVEEWPACERCASCGKVRVVDRAQCEHCGAGFAPPEKTGTELFEAVVPLGQ